MGDTKVDSQYKSCIEQYEAIYPKGKGFPSCKDLTAEEDKLPEDQRDPIKMLRPVGPEIINICASRKSITNLNDPSFHSHNPDEYQFCKAEDKKYYVIWPSQQKFQDINDIVRITRELNKKEIEFAGIKRTNDKAAKTLSEEGRFLSPTTLIIGTLGVLSGAIIFGRLTNYFDWLSEKTVVSSKELTKLRRQWAMTEYGQEIIKEELKAEIAAEENNQTFDRCTNFSNTLWDAKKTAFWDTLRSPFVIATVLTPALLYAGLRFALTSQSVNPPISDDQSSSETGDMTEKQEIKFRSVRYGKTNEEVNKERIKITHELEKLEEKLRKEHERTNFLAKSIEEASSQSVAKTVTAVGGAAATGITFGVLVPMVHYTLVVIKPWQSPEQTARSSLRIEETKKAYQRIINDGKRDAVKLYIESCYERPFTSYTTAEVQVVQPLLPASADAESRKPILALPAVAEPTAPPITDDQADTILAQRSWMGWISDTVAPLKSFTNSIGVTSTMPTAATGQFATAGWGASIRTFFTIRPAPTPVRVR